MKRLKFAHLFCGRSYPLYFIGGAAFFGAFYALFKGSEHIILWAVIPPILVTLGFVVFFNIPDDHDIAARRDASYPLWSPLPDPLLNSIRSMEEEHQMSAATMIILAAICGGLVFALTRIPPRHSPEPVMSLGTSGICGLVAGGAAFFLILYFQYRCRVWSGIDDTAVYTTVPIDHFFDVTQHGKNGQIWITSYLVFYQPDGRYILRAPEGSGGADEVTIVKYRGMIRCMVLQESDLK